MRPARIFFAGLLGIAAMNSAALAAPAAQPQVFDLNKANSPACSRALINFERKLQIATRHNQVPNSDAFRKACGFPTGANTAQAIKNLPPGALLAIMGAAIAAGQGGSGRRCYSTPFDC